MIRKMYTSPSIPGARILIETEMKLWDIPDCEASTSDINHNRAVVAWIPGHSRHNFPVAPHNLSDVPKRKVRYYKSEHELLQLAREGALPNNDGAPESLANSILILAGKRAIAPDGIPEEWIEEREEEEI